MKGEILAEEGQEGEALDHGDGDRGDADIDREERTAGDQQHEHVASREPLYPTGVKVDDQPEHLTAGGQRQGVLGGIEEDLPPGSTADDVADGGGHGEDEHGGNDAEAQQQGKRKGRGGGDAALSVTSGNPKWIQLSEDHEND